MPIAAKFSKEFYAKLGHGIADELVDWFNRVDATYRSEFRELFEVNFARFDAKLEQRLAEIKAEFREEIAGLRAEFSSRLSGLESRLIRWMFLFWVGTLGTVIALLKL
ncbi:MAG: hypothetical protein ACE5HT_04340 [Gemmatimonadales bacterium]